MADANGNAPQPQAENAAFLQTGTIRMDRERALRFSNALSVLYNTLHSLQASTKAFPSPELEEDCLEPRSTVTAFAKSLLDQTDFIIRMIDCADMQKGGVA